MAHQLSIVFHTVLAVGLLVGLFDGVEREFNRLVKLETEAEDYKVKFRL
jgi:hypothetical protein